MYYMISILHTVDNCLDYLGHLSETNILNNLKKTIVDSLNNLKTVLDNLIGLS